MAWQHEPEGLTVSEADVPLNSTVFFFFFSFQLV